jgi:hypothetical protein
MVNGAEFALGLGADFAGGDDAVGIFVLCIPQTILVETKKPP